MKGEGDMKKAIYKHLIISLVKMYWQILKPHTYGVKAIILCDNEVLLVKNISEDSWHLPGGGVKKDEAKLEAVKREVREELKIDLDFYAKKLEENKLVKSNLLLGTYTSNKEGKQDTIHVYVYKLASKVKFELHDNELSDARWFNIDTLIDYGVTPYNRTDSISPAYDT